MTENPYGLLNLWQQGDWITKSVALALLSMSVLSWYVLVLKSLQQNRLNKLAKLAGGSFWHSKSLEQVLQCLDEKSDGSIFRTLVEDGVQASGHHARNRSELHGMLNLSEWLTSCLRRSIENFTHDLQANLVILASIGSTAPFVGLFGTVWGIYHALVGISVSGQASIDKVAGPVGEALIMTAFGLAVAIPAVLGYNALVNGNKKILAQVRNFAHDLHAYLLTDGRVNAPSPEMSELSVHALKQEGERRELQHANG